MAKYIDADILKTLLEERHDMATGLYGDLGGAVSGCIKLLDKQPASKVYTTHEVAVILAEVMGDDCACNFNGNSDWLPEYCEFSETVCPDVCGVACWEQYLKHLDKKPKEEEENDNQNL